MCGCGCGCVRGCVRGGVGVDVCVGVVMSHESVLCVCTLGSEGESVRVCMREGVHTCVGACQV